MTPQTTASGQHLLSAAHIIRAGGVIAYPTETVYGLGCDPFDEDAVRRLLAIKQRPVEKGLILVASDLDQLDGLAPVTYLLDATERVPAWIRGVHPKVAVRVSAHPLARALVAAVGTPIVSTSANRAGRPPGRNRFQVGKALGGDLDFIVTGDCDPRGKPSTIIDLQSGRTLRD